MSTITNVATPSALSILTGPNGPLSNLSSQTSQSILKSASPADLVSLSNAALGLQEANSLFGGTPVNNFGGTTPVNNPATDDLSILSAVYGFTPPSSTASAATDPTQALLFAAYGLTPPPTSASTVPWAPSASTGTLLNTVD